MAEVLPTIRQNEVSAYLPAYEPNEGDEAPSYEDTRREIPSAVIEAEHMLNADEEVIRIGSKFTLSLVTEGQLVQHLIFLKALHRLKLDAMEAASTHYDGFTGLTGGEPREKAWQVFVRRAIHRFEAWFGKIANNPSPSLTVEEFTRYTTSLIPLDIAMVWHAYVLNPLEYYEDEVRGLNTMKARAFPLAELTQTIDRRTLRPRIIDNWAQETFQMATGISYHPPFATSSSEVLYVQCPACDDPVWNVVHWLDDAGAGYAQESFAATCRVCNSKFTREAMGIRKLTNDIYMWKKHKDRHCLAGTRLNPHTGEAWREASKLTRVLTAPMLSLSAFKNIDVPPSSMAKALKFKRSEVEYYFRQSVMGVEGLRTDVNTRLRIREILASYTSSSPFSVDLVGAVNSQQDFIGDIQKLIHSKSDSSGCNEIAAIAVARYCAYWELATEQPKRCQIPSLDIDLCLHTHQLHWGRYRHQSLELIGRIPDHERLSDPTGFSQALRITAETWKSRYGVGYAQGDTGDSMKAPRMFARLLHSRKPSRGKVKAKEALLWKSIEFEPFTAPSTHYQTNNQLDQRNGKSKRSSSNQNYMPLRPLEALDISELYSPGGDAFSAYWGIWRNTIDLNNPYDSPTPFSWSEKKRDEQRRKTPIA